MSFINQSIRSAIVPMVVAHRPLYRRRDMYMSERSNWERLPHEQVTLAHQWFYIHGMYSFNDAMPGDHAPRLSVVEAQMMINSHLHDFCGGTMVTSGRASLYEFIPSWGVQDLGTVGMSAYKSTSENVARLPCINDALRSELPISREQALAIMRRSLMAAAMSWSLGCGKRGIIGFDRSTTRHQLRTVMRAARSLKWIPSRYPTYPALSPAAIQAARVNQGTGMLSAPTYHVVPVRVRVNEDITYINRNSGNRVGPIMLTYLVNGEEEPEAGDLPDDYDDETSIYLDDDDDDDDDASSISPSLVGHSYPDWFVDAADRPVFASTFPIGPFSNG